ncbi:MAG TPA: radical SAM protein [Acidimicrobiales bacterium]|nr:radical SAM protein [Acidimicrobiales bacterium]
MRVLLLSTYELGHQPLGIAGPAAALEAAGHETRGFDLSVSDLALDALVWAEAAAISIPMHTATRLSREAIAALRLARPELPVAWHGLYAPVLSDGDLLRPPDLLVAGEVVPVLLAWLDSLQGEAPSSSGGVRIELGRPRPAARGLRPLRRDLPPLERYARLRLAGVEIVTASVAASTGCNHRCKHCPVAAVYRGRSRLIDAGVVLEDIAQVVAAGAGHVSFADPDFLNRPGHALEVARRLHAEFPAVTFDATVKVEHIIRHRQLWPEFRHLGLLFVVSAFESVDDGILDLLDKGHRAADEALALAIVRAAGVELRPSWLPFTPWTTLASVAALLEFVADQDLVWSTDAVQYSIRLLLPNGSLLLETPDAMLAGSLRGSVDGSAEWVAQDAGLDELQAAIAARAELAADELPDVTFAAIWELARRAGAPLSASPPAPRVSPWLPGPERPRLTESWFCCAEPTSAQRRRLGVPS